MGLYIKHIKLQEKKLDSTQLRVARACAGRRSSGFCSPWGGGGGGDLCMLQNVTAIKKSDYYTETHGARIRASGTTSKKKKIGI